MLTRIFLLLAVAMLPLCAQSSLNDGGRMLPPATTTVKPVDPYAPTTLQPGVDAPPNGIPAPLPERPAAPARHCYIKEFTVTPSIVREGPLYLKTMRTHIVLNVPAPHQMLIHIITSDNTKVAATSIVILKNVQSADGGIEIKWKAIQHDGKFEFKAFSDDDTDLIFHSRIYIKKLPVE